MKHWKKENIAEIFFRAGPNIIKPFYGRNLRVLVIVRVFVPGKPFQSRLMFVDNPTSLPFSGAPER
jgi:hypothetical protein